MASFYHDNLKDTSQSPYKNCYYALTIALEKYLADTLLEGDTSRVILSSTDYALQKRSGKSEWNNANLPFVNYKLSSTDGGGNRSWFSNEAYTQGVYVKELGVKVKLIPVTFTLDCTFWTGRNDDYHYAMDKILFAKSAETRMSYDLAYGTDTVKNIAIISFDLDSSIQFTEKDWLEQHNVWALGINPEVQSFLMDATTEGFCIPEEVLIDFLVKKEVITTGEEVTSYDELLTLTVDHINETLTVE